MTAAGVPVLGWLMGLLLAGTPPGDPLCGAEVKPLAVRLAHGGELGVGPVFRRGAPVPVTFSARYTPSLALDDAQHWRLGAAAGLLWRNPKVDVPVGARILRREDLGAPVVGITLAPEATVGLASGRVRLGAEVAVDALRIPAVGIRSLVDVSDGTVSLELVAGLSLAGAATPPRTRPAETREDLLAWAPWLTARVALRSSALFATLPDTFTTEAAHQAALRDWQRACEARAQAFRHYLAEADRGAGTNSLVADLAARLPELADAVLAALREAAPPADAADADVVRAIFAGLDRTAAGPSRGGP